MSQGTRIFPLGELQEMSPEDALNYVFDSLNQKGYNPINQIVGYLISGDPLYISSHNNARSVIQRVERDEIVELLLATYIKSK